MINLKLVIIDSYLTSALINTKSTAEAPIDTQTLKQCCALVARAKVSRHKNCMIGALMVDNQHT